MKDLIETNKPDLVKLIAEANGGCTSPKRANGYNTALQVLKAYIDGAGGQNSNEVIRSAIRVDTPGLDSYHRNPAKPSSEAGEPEQLAVYEKAVKFIKEAEVIAESIAAILTGEDPISVEDVVILEEYLDALLAVPYLFKLNGFLEKIEREKDASQTALKENRELVKKFNDEYKGVAAAARTFDQKGFQQAQHAVDKAPLIKEKARKSEAQYSAVIRFGIAMAKDVYEALSLAHGIAAKDGQVCARVQALLSKSA